MSRDTFARRSRLSKSLLDEAPDEIAHRYPAQGRAGLKRAVEAVWKVNSGSHKSIFASSCVPVNVEVGLAEVSFCQGQIALNLYSAKGQQG